MRNAESDKLTCRRVRMLHRAKRTTRDPRNKSEIPRELGSDRIAPILTKLGGIQYLRPYQREGERERKGERESSSLSRDEALEVRSEIESLHNRERILACYRETQVPQLRERKSAFHYLRKIII